MSIPSSPIQKSSNPPSRRDKGRNGEDLAAAFLEGKGYRILARNIRMGRAEIDIIAEDGPTLVFIEVKTRHSTLFGAPEESITPFQQRQIEAAAELYMARNEIDRPCRCDVVAIQFKGKHSTIRHIENAFF